MEIKFLVSLLLLETIFNNANLIIPPDGQLTKCSKGNFNSDNLLKARDLSLDELYKGVGNSFKEDGHGNGVSAMSVCPPNIKKEDCQECVNKTIPILKKNCPKQNEGAAWSVVPTLYCMVHYAETPKNQLVAEWVQFSPKPPAAPPSPNTGGELEKGLNNMANKFKEIINGVGNHARYGSGSVTYGPGSHTLYGSMQCYVPIVKEVCMKCLSEATKQIIDCCGKLRKQSGRVFSVNCAFWYAHDNFLPKTLPTISVTPPHILG